MKIVPMFQAVLFCLALGAQAQGGWVSQGSPSKINLYSVSFVNANTGWAVGDSLTVRKTVNGGSTWALDTVGTGYFVAHKIFSCGRFTS